jgi:ADP-ribosylglycohydrolase
MSSRKTAKNTKNVRFKKTEDKPKQKSKYDEESSSEEEQKPVSKNNSQNDKSDKANSAKKNMLKGLMFGSALGEAIGLQFKNKTSEDIVSRSESDKLFMESEYNLGFPYRNMINGVPICDWIDKTDQLIIVMDTLRECISNNRLADYSKIQFNDPPVRELRLKTDESHKLHTSEKNLSPEKLFGHRLKIWCTDGFPAIGDDCGKGVEGMILQTTTRVGYVRNPIGTAQNIWTHRNKPATNSCVPRSAIIGIVDNYSDMLRLADRFCHITHPDPRCRAAAIIMAHMIHTISHTKVRKEKLEDMMMVSYMVGRNFLKDSKHKTQLDKYFYSTLDGLELNVEGVSDFCFRALGAGIWALRFVCRTKDLKNVYLRVIKRIVYCGGDATTNSSVAGLLMGAWLGYDKLPKLVEEMPNNDWLNESIDKFLKQKIVESADSESESEYTDESESEEEYESDSQDVYD